MAYLAHQVTFKNQDGAIKIGLQPADVFTVMLLNNAKINVNSVKTFFEKATQ